MNQLYTGTEIGGLHLLCGARIFALSAVNGRFNAELAEVRRGSAKKTIRFETCANAQGLKGSVD
jgi:hypothetical protein